jgi:hypothetical protein
MYDVHTYYCHVLLYIVRIYYATINFNHDELYRGELNTVNCPATEYDRKFILLKKCKN